MYTLVDFVTHVKGVEYILSLLFIAGFLLLWEVLKPAPFRSVVATGKDDLEYIQRSGAGGVLATAGKLAAAPFIGLAYLAMLPIGFAAVAAAGAVNLLLKGVNTVAGALGISASFDWRPMEAYFTGKKEHKSAENDKK